MKPIDKNQQRIAYFLSQHGTANRDDLMPLIEWDENKQKAYNAVIAKLTMTGIIRVSSISSDKGRELYNYTLTQYGKDNLI